ncbi:MAG: T9SS type A sorting domain-containing protein [Candidatus Azobacteroides sp.]|nr:T9SS type A sorting domain-containing protein [Candidatus Azobacteroides sp.]
MKLNYFLRLFTVVALMALAVNVKATEITIPNGATDTELTAALAEAETGDVILINGVVTINAMVPVEKNVTFRGVGNAYFDGGGNARLFEIYPEVIDGAKLVFENLGFTGGNGWGSDPADGGVARIYGGGVVEFNDCWFDDNKASRGGAFFITGEATGTTTTVTFIKCEASDNVAYGNGTESRAGYLFADGNTNIAHEYCKITSNQSIGGRGGAFCLFGTGTHYFYYTVISDNKAGKWDDGRTTLLDYDGNPIDGGESEGGAFWITGGAITFESCGIVANQSWSHSPAIMNSGETNVTFINSTVAKNEVVHDGRAPIWTQGGPCTYTFVNSFFVENIGSNSGNGGGFDGNSLGITPAGAKQLSLNLFNSVFARNTFQNNEGTQDIRAIPNYAQQLTVKNSLIGFISGDDSGVVPVDNPDIPTISNVRMYKDVSADPTQTAQLMDIVLTFPQPGINFDQGVRQSKSYGMPYYLLEENSTVTQLGDPALLELYGERNFDLFERPYPIASDGSIPAAPTLVATGDKYDDSNLGPNPTGIQTPSVIAVKPSIHIIGSSNGILGVDFGDLKGNAKGTLVNIAGQEVEKVFDLNVVGKGYYNIHVTPGMYILQVEIGGKTYAQKLIVTK